MIQGIRINLENQRLILTKGKYFGGSFTAYKSPYGFQDGTIIMDTADLNHLVKAHNMVYKRKTDFEAIFIKILIHEIFHSTLMKVLETWEFLELCDVYTAIANNNPKEICVEERLADEISGYGHIRYFRLRKKFTKRYGCSPRTYLYGD